MLRPAGAELIKFQPTAEEAAMRAWGRRKAGGGLAAGLVACALTAFMVAAPADAAVAASAGAALAAAAPAGAAVAPAWQIKKSPNATVPGGQLESVSCSSANACTAVGTNVGAKGLNVTLAERWNGKTWQQQHTPNLAGNTVP